MMKRLYLVIIIMNSAQSNYSLYNDTNYNYYVITSYASYYHDKFNGRKTASGETFSNSKLTAAHRTLPFGTKVKVTNLRNDQSVVVVINYRGPFTASRALDLSKAAFDEIANLDRGT